MTTALQAAEIYRNEVKKEVLDDLERTFKGLREIYVLHKADASGNLRVTISEQELVDFCASVAMAKRLIEKEV